MNPHQLPTYGLPPWHMWGSSATIAGVVSSLTPAVASSGQLSRINYARPETWSFLFMATLLSAPDNDPAESTLITVRFDLMAGIGRSVARMPPSATLGAAGSAAGFVEFRFSYTGAFSPQNSKWTTIALSPRLDETDANSRFPLEHFVAQDIQCGARATGVSTLPLGPPATFQVEVHSYFAPRTHLRPEWFGKSGAQFRGNEQGGS